MTGLGCGNENDIVTFNTRGFIIRGEDGFWKFFPIESMNVSNCQDNFDAKKIGIGLGFYEYSVPNVSFLTRTLDTLTLDKEVFGSKYILISPVQISYKITRKFIGIRSQQRSNYQINFNGKQIDLQYDQFPLEIKNIEPLFCLYKKKTDVKECECKHSNDLNDYLFKICEYIKKGNKYSHLPDLYKIKRISNEVLDNRKVVKVELNCCYTGDFAYFDYSTGEIISVHFGAM